MTSPKSAILPGDGRYMMSTLAVGDDGLTVVKQVTVARTTPNAICPDQRRHHGSGCRNRPVARGSGCQLDHRVPHGGPVGGGRATAGRSRVGIGGFCRQRGTGPQPPGGVRRHVPAEARVCVYGRGKENVDALCAVARDMGLEADASSNRPKRRFAVRPGRHLGHAGLLDPAVS